MIISEKIRKYQELCEELRLLEVKVLPIILSSNGLIPEDTLKSIKLLGLSWELQEIQKAVIMGTASIVRKIFNISN